MSFNILTTPTFHFRWGNGSSILTITNDNIKNFVEVNTSVKKILYVENQEQKEIITGYSVAMGLTDLTEIVIPNTVWDIVDPLSYNGPRFCMVAVHDDFLHKAIKSILQEALEISQLKDDILTIKHWNRKVDVNASNRATFFRHIREEIINRQGKPYSLAQLFRTKTNLLEGLM